MRLQPRSAAISFRRASSVSPTFAPRAAGRRTGRPESRSRCRAAGSAWRGNGQGRPARRPAPQPAPRRHGPDRESSPTPSPASPPVHGDVVEVAIPPEQRLPPRPVPRRCGADDEVDHGSNSRLFRSNPAWRAVSVGVADYWNYSIPADITTEDGRPISSSGQGLPTPRAIRSCSLFQCVVADRICPRLNRCAHASTKSFPASRSFSICSRLPSRWIKIEMPIEIFRTI